MQDRVLVLASVASMIDQFNIPNIKLLIEMGFHVDVACNFMKGNTCSDEKISNLKADLKDMGVGIYQIDFARNAFEIKQNCTAFRQVLNIMRTNRYKFIHCHSPIGGLCGRVAGRMTNAKVIYTAHGFHFYKGAPLTNWLVYYPIERFLSRYTDVLITINKEDYAHAQKFHAAKVEYVPGVGIDVNKFKECPINKMYIRDKLHIANEQKILLSVGELIKRKNHQIVIRAIAQIKNENIIYIVCGQGPLETSLKKLAVDLNVADRIYFLGFRKDIREICKSSDIFVFPSIQEGLPVALMEAMAAGLPVVCSKIRGNTDLIEDGVSGYLFENSNIDSLQSAISKALADTLSMAKLFNKINHFSQGNVLEQMKKIYNNII